MGHSQWRTKKDTSWSSIGWLKFFYFIRITRPKIYLIICFIFKIELKVVKALIGLPDGGLASGSWDSTIKIWNPQYAELKRTLTGHTSGVLSLGILPNGELLSASADKTIKIWRYDKGESVHTLNAHNDSIWVITLLNKGDIASCSADATIKIWTQEAPQISSVSQMSYNSIRHKNLGEYVTDQSLYSAR